MKPSVTSYCKYDSDNVGLAFIFLPVYEPEILVGVSFGTIAIVMCKRALQQEQGLCQSVHWQGIKRYYHWF